MKSEVSARKWLFVCTKPYQYLICRLIKEGFSYNKCDLLVLKHFEDAERFAEAIDRLSVWNRVFLEDDTVLNLRNAQLGVVQKFLFYHRWKQLLPRCISSYNEYDGLYFAHEGVAMEYGLMRQFTDQGKHTIIYEEGCGNYISVNFHMTPMKSLLKELSHWFGIPGNYIGRLKYVDAVILQRPDILDKRNPIKKKAHVLPLTLREFLSCKHIEQEMCTVYPEIQELSAKTQERDVVAILFGESWWDTLPNRERYLHRLLNRAKDMIDIPLKGFLIKQHPGEVKGLGNLVHGHELIPKRLPLELLHLALKRNVKHLFIITFGSTAVLNLYDLFSVDCNTDIVILKDSSLNRRNILEIERFCLLVEKFRVPYSLVTL